MPSISNRVGLLAGEDCPVDLDDPIALYEQLKSYLNGLGQMDGYWSEAGKLAIPVAYPDSLLARKLQEKFNPGFVVRTSKRCAEKCSDFAEEIVHMSRIAGREFANGWRIFPVMIDEAEDDICWLVEGMLFPAYDGKTEGWIIFAEVSEIFG